MRAETSQVGLEAPGERAPMRFVMEMLDERVALTLRALTPSERVEQGNKLTVEMRTIAKSLRASVREQALSNGAAGSVGGGAA